MSWKFFEYFNDSYKKLFEYSRLSVNSYFNNEILSKFKQIRNIGQKGFYIR